MTNTTLTRRAVTALARLDMAGLGHMQRIDAIAQALGFETGASLMSVLKAAETGAAPAPAGIPAAAGEEATHKALVIWDRYSGSAFQNGELLDADEVNSSVVAFATAAELSAYVDGINAACGWEEPVVVENTTWGYATPYLDACRETPALTLAAWHNERMTEDLDDEADDDGLGPE